MRDAARSEGRESLYGFATMTGGMSALKLWRFKEDDEDEEWNEAERWRRVPLKVGVLEGDVLADIIRGGVPPPAA